MHDVRGALSSREKKLSTTKRPCKRVICLQACRAPIYENHVLRDFLSETSRPVETVGLRGAGHGCGPHWRHGGALEQILRKGRKGRVVGHGPAGERFDRRPGRARGSGHLGKGMFSPLEFHRKENFREMIPTRNFYDDPGHVRDVARGAGSADGLVVDGLEVGARDDDGRYCVGMLDVCGALNLVWLGCRH